MRCIKIYPITPLLDYVFNDVARERGNTCENCLVNRITVNSDIIFFWKCFICVYLKHCQNYCDDGNYLVIIFNSVLIIKLKPL